ncbi:putative dissimilatory sulfite reductase A (dsrA), partial [marine sediment metagenome]
YADAGKDIQGDVIDLCPTQCMAWDGSALKINNKMCNRCIHCINVLPKALSPGKESGATLLVGGKAPILEGAQLASVMVPFVEAKAPFTEIKDFIEKLWDVWGENGNNRERIGEFILRVGLGDFVEAIELEPDPNMVLHPREIGEVGVAADDAGAVALNPDKPSVLPVGDLVSIGLFELGAEVLRHGVRLGHFLHLRDKAGPFPLFQLVEKW